MAESSPNEQKTMWVKEKLLVTSNFSFSNSVFKRLEQQTRKNQGLFGKGIESINFCKINMHQIIFLVYDRVENIVGKGENAGYQYLFSLDVFGSNAIAFASASSCKNFDIL